MTLDALDDGRPRQLEFVCERCLASVMGTDLDPVPRCPRGHGRMTPDSDERAARYVRPAGCGRTRGRPPRYAPEPADAT